MTKISALTTSAMAVALVLPLALPTASFAADELVLEEIIVTARKRKEDVQTVPIAIQAYTADDLAERNVTNLTDLGNSTPGLSVTSISGGSFTNIYVRGLAPANSSADLNVEANVGVFIDGIYQTSRNTADIMQVVDIAQLDVVKGPQSALYGRSTFAGALGITTKRPAKQAEGKASITIGSDADYRGKVSLSTPVIEDKLYASIAGSYARYDGSWENKADPDDNLGGYEKRGVSGSLQFFPTEKLTATLTGFATDADTEVSSLYLTDVTKNNCGGFNAASQAQLLICGDLAAPDVNDVSDNIPLSYAKARQVALEVEYELDAFSIVSVSGITGSEFGAYNDYDGSSVGSLYGVCTLGTTCAPATGTFTRTVRSNAVLANTDKVRTTSQELRIQSPDEDRLQWLAGAFFFRSTVKAMSLNGTDRAGLASNERLVQVQPGSPAGTGPIATLANLQLVPDTGSGNLVASGLSNRQNVTKSVFGSLGYEVIDGLRVAAEGRYNIDRKSDHCSFTFFGAFGPCPGAQPQRAEFKSFTPRFTVDYKATEDVFLFASAAKGVRSGGFNAVGGLAASELTFDEEENWTYEAGVKSWLFDRRLMLNASVFRVNWTNLQISTFSTNPAVIQAIVTNVGEMKTNGIEAQAEFKATDILSFGGGVTYSDPKFGDGAYDPANSVQCGNPSTACDLVTIPGRGLQASIEGNRPARAVKLQYNIHATADVPVSADWTLVGRVDVNHTGKAYTNSLNLTSFGERTLGSLRLALESEQYSLAAWVTNVTDEKYNANAIQQPRLFVAGAQRVTEAYLGERRRFGFTGTAKF